VETQAQFEIARREGFTEAQGFWIGRSMNGAAIAERDDLYRGTTKPKRRPGPSVGGKDRGRGRGAMRKSTS
jgi:hypothetical protein